jgi:hypothetical protein
VSSTVADEHDASEPLDRDPSVAYRFGALSDLTGGLHLSGLKTETHPAPGEAVWAGLFGFSFGFGPAGFEFGPFRF